MNHPYKVMEKCDYCYGKGNTSYINTIGDISNSKCKYCKGTGETDTQYQVTFKEVEVANNVETTVNKQCQVVSQKSGYDAVYYYITEVI